MLKYNNKGWLPGVPARDLNDEEVKKFGGEDFLLKSGLYEKVKTYKKIQDEKDIKEGE